MSPKHKKKKTKVINIDADNEVQEIGTKSQLHQMFTSFFELSPEDVQKAAEEGIEVKKGRYSKEEIAVIDRIFKMRAREEFLKTGREDTEDNFNEFLIDFFGYFTFRSRHSGPKKGKIVPIINEIGLTLTNRSVASIFHKLKDRFNPLPSIAILSKEQREEIITILENEGKNRTTFTKIAMKYHVKPRSVQNLKYLNLTADGKRVYHNKFTCEDEKRLVEAAMTAAKVKTQEELLEKEIPWPEVSKLMGDKTTRACKEHFYSCLVWKIGVVDVLVGDIHQRFEDSAKIIYYIYMEGYKCSQDVDWSDISSKLPHLNIGQLMSLMENMLAKVPSSISSYKTFKMQINWLFINIVKKFIELTPENQIIMEKFYSS